MAIPDGRGEHRVRFASAGWSRGRGRDETAPPRPHRCRNWRSFASGEFPSAGDDWRVDRDRNPGRDLAACRALFPRRPDGRGQPRPARPFPAAREVGGARPAGGGHRHRAGHRRHHGGAERLERPLLRRAAEPQLGQFRLRARLLLRAGGDVHPARRLPDLSEPVAADPLAAVDDRAAARRMAGRGQPLPHAAARRESPTIRTSASPRISSSSSAARCRSASACSAPWSRWCRSSASCGRCRPRRR